MKYANKLKLAESFFRASGKDVERIRNSVLVYAKRHNFQITTKRVKGGLFVRRKD